MMQRYERWGVLMFATIFVGFAAAKIALALWAPLRDQIRWTSADTSIVLGNLLVAATLVARAYRPALVRPLIIATLLVLVAGVIAGIRLFL